MITHRSRQRALRTEKMVCDDCILQTFVLVLCIHDTVCINNSQFREICASKARSTLYGSVKGFKRLLSNHKLSEILPSGYLFSWWGGWSRHLGPDDLDTCFLRPCTPMTLRVILEDLFKKISMAFTSEVCPSGN